MNKIELFSERLKLRLIDSSDLKSIHELHSLQETDEYNTLGIPKNIDETKSIVEPWISENQLKEFKNYTFAVELNPGHQFIGLFGFRNAN